MSATEVVPPIAATGTHDGEAIWFLGTLSLVKASQESTDGHMAVIEMIAPPGFGSPLHVHHREDEWFYVIEGELTVWVDGEVIQVPAGSFRIRSSRPSAHVRRQLVDAGSFPSGSSSRPGSRTSFASSASPPKRSRSHR